MSAALHTHRIQITLTQDGTLTLDDLPFQAGEAVEVVVQPYAATPESASNPLVRYPLRGLVVPYDRPCSSRRLGSPSMIMVRGKSSVIFPKRRPAGPRK